MDAANVNDPQAEVLDQDGGLGRESLHRMASDAGNLLAAVNNGQLAIDPESAREIAKAYDDMVDDIYWIKVGLLTAGQNPQLGIGPYAKQVSAYQHEAAEAFKDATLQLETVCTQSAQAYRTAAEHYVAMEEGAADAFKRIEGTQ